MEDAGRKARGLQMMLNEPGDIRIVLKHKNNLAQPLYPRLSIQSGRPAFLRDTKGLRPNRVILRVAAKGQRNCKRLMNLLGCGITRSAEPTGFAKPAPQRDQRNTVSRARPYRRETP